MPLGQQLRAKFASISPRAKKSMLAGALLLAALGAAQLLWQPFGHARTTRIAPLEIDLFHPDAVVLSHNLAQLPKDLLKVPLLRDTLTEDFAFYYQEHEHKLSVLGTLRRVAYEHSLSLPENVALQVLNAPAELALWRGPTGKLDYWLLALERNAVSRVIHGLASATLTDRQLGRIGEITVDGDEVPLYALNVSAQHTLLFAAHGERAVILSDPSMLLAEPKYAPDPDEEVEAQSASAPAAMPKQAAPVVSGKLRSERVKLLQALLNKDAKQQATLRHSLNLSTLPKSGHSAALGVNYLSFGYQTFFPGLMALRFDFNGQAWSSAALVEGALLKPGAWQPAALWRAIPTAPAACATVPLDWPAAAKLAERVAQQAVKQPEQIGEWLDGPVAACWYGKSRLASPLFVARFKTAQAAQQAAPVLFAMFEQIIGAKEFGRKELERFPVRQKTLENGATLWQRTVSARYGSQLAKPGDFNGQLSAARYFPVSMAVSGQTLLFSPDSQLVHQALAVAARSYPAAADGLAAPERVLAKLTPKTLASLLQREMFASLPKDEEPVFRAAADGQLRPRLQALAAYPPLTVRLAGKLPPGRGWVPLELAFDHAHAP